MRMSVQLLEQYLSDLGFTPGSYSIGEPAADQDSIWCVVDDGAGWTVFYSERGSRWDEERFGSEKVACMYMLGLFAQKYIEQKLVRRP